MLQRTLVVLKPDAVQRYLVGRIVDRFEQKWLKVIGAKMLCFNDTLIGDMYSHIKNLPIFQQFREYITSGPVLALVLEWEDAIISAKKMCGSTNPVDAFPWTIRADFAKNLDNNIIHASDCGENVDMEILLFFDENEIYSKPCNNK
jgi:nucleoside-diphosphate kinase